MEPRRFLSQAARHLLEVSRRKKDRLPIILWILLLIFLLAACKQKQPKPEQTQIHISVPQSTVTHTPDASPFVFTTYEVTPPLEPSPTLVFKPSLYIHPLGIFSLQPPENWSVEEQNRGVLFTDLQGDLKFEVGVVNTGYILSPSSFNNLIEILEKNKTTGLDEYIETDRQEVPEENSILLGYAFSQNGSAKVGVSLYQQSENVVIFANLQASQAYYEPYREQINAVLASIHMEPEKIANLPVYSVDLAARQTFGDFSILIPPYWSARHTEENSSIIDTFASPDEHAVIQIVTYDDGQFMSKQIAGEFILNLLRNNYTKEISVVQDEVLQDGREKLTWKSNQDYQGISSFSVRGTTLSVLTVMWGNDPDQLYQTIMMNVFGSYALED